MSLLSFKIIYLNYIEYFRVFNKNGFLTEVFVVRFTFDFINDIKCIYERKYINDVYSYYSIYTDNEREILSTIIN